MASDSSVGQLPMAVRQRIIREACREYIAGNISSDEYTARVRPYSAIFRRGLIAFDSQIWLAIERRVPWPVKRWLSGW